MRIITQLYLVPATNVNMARGVTRSLTVALLCCCVVQCVSVDYTPLEGDAVYQFSWAGSSSAARAEDVALRTTTNDKSDDVTGLLANELLAPGFTDEVIVMATASQEKYKCVLPQSPTSEEEEDEELESKYLTPESLLQPLQFQCLKLSHGYWAYELCHGQILRQYHEENTGKEIKVDEYILGKGKRSSVGDSSEDRDEERREEGDKRKIPTWHFNGFDYPYHKVEMGGGTPCDLRGNNPRSVSILYICQTDAQTYGSLLLVEESSACHYVAIVGSKQLCQNRDYRLKEQPVYTISCYSEGSSPKKPGRLREQEFEIVNIVPKQPTTSDNSKSPPKTRGSQGSKVSQSSPGPSLDEAIIMTFLTGEMCLRGGSGWWIHELCLMKQVKQIHQEVDNSETDVLLGVWSEEVHREWYEREGYKKHTALSVTHLYSGGDICDFTGKPRLCYVRFKCSRKSTSPSQISLYLTEQSVCVYTLTVEAQFICPLLEEVDRYGQFQLVETSSSRLFNEGAPRTDDGSESETGTKSGQSHGEGKSVKQESDSVNPAGWESDPTEQVSDSAEWESDTAEQESDSSEQESDSKKDSDPNSRQRAV